MESNTTKTTNINNSTYTISFNPATSTSTSLSFDTTTSTIKVNPVNYYQCFSSLFNQNNDKFIDYKITKIEILKPYKVLRFTFADKTIIKTICDDMDTFDLDFACFLAISKKIYGKDWTADGVYSKTFELMEQKCYIKIVKQAISQFKKEQKEKEQKERIEKEQKEAKIRQAEKRRKKRKEAKNRRINELAEAIKKSK